MSWQLYPDLSLRNGRVPDEDADRQMRTAREILKRMDTQPGVVLADEVGMGKTFVALAVAVSAVLATRKRHPVVVMVPASVAEKWPKEWEVFSQCCLPPDHGLRASETIRRGGPFMKLLDDDAERRKHIIFLTHGALNQNLADPFIKLALIRRALLHRLAMAPVRRAVERFAGELLVDRRFDEMITHELLRKPVSHWWTIWDRYYPDAPLDDDPVPFAVDRIAKEVDLDELRDALLMIPRQRNASFGPRLKSARSAMRKAMNDVWKACLQALKLHLPLLIMDEAHHVKNENRLAGLFANEEARHDSEALQGALANIFQHMLFLTATPFQLGHHELLNVLDRFHGVHWPSQRARRRFDDQLAALGAALDRAQASALRLERAWGRIDPDDCEQVMELTTLEPQPDHPESIKTALSVANEAQRDIRQAVDALRPWVIRHTRPDKARRRMTLAGKAIVSADLDGSAIEGLSISGEALLPFLLAARAQAVASLEGQSGTRATRSLYAYGLASSFEAYADTRRNRLSALDEAEEVEETAQASAQLSWYLDQISAALPAESDEGWSSHPKVAAVVERVRQLWLAGEKVVIFCFYVETGRALRSHISRALMREILEKARLGLALETESDGQALEALGRISDRLLRKDSAGYELIRGEVIQLCDNLADEDRNALAEIVIRFMRTPSFLVRFVDLSPQITVDDLVAGFRRPDQSGRSMTDKVADFARAFELRVGYERRQLMEALEGIQTGSIVVKAEDFDGSELARHREMLLPNVRLSNGGVKHETRERLMLGFNSPFFPEILVASSVMAEGVDLHQNCRYIIHHDLDWNPSTLEQRTGRLDRIGSKSSQSGHPIVIYEPYLAGTHDEKMYRVVKDRERWFGVVMGGTSPVDERSTEGQSQRIPLPPSIADLLTMDLSL